MKKIIWIFCLSTTATGLLEDTIWNIEAAMNYLRDQAFEDEISAILLVGDIRLHGKTQSVPQMMEAYIKTNFPAEYEIYGSRIFLESKSLTSRENVPYALGLLDDLQRHPAYYDHILCSENLHTRLLSYLLTYHIRRRYHRIIEPQRVKSAQKVLGFKGRFKRLLQQVDVRLDPEGKSPWYRRRLKQRGRYLNKQT